MARQWTLTGQNGFEASLDYQENVKIPAGDALGQDDVLVRLRGASLNYRDVLATMPGVSDISIQGLETGTGGADSDADNHRPHPATSGAWMRWRG
jgi:NADPH:quinone reductase-like Zn-dependent oxidoreductase